MKILYFLFSFCSCIFLQAQEIRIVDLGTGNNNISVVNSAGTFTVTPTAVGATITADSLRSLLGDGPVIVTTASGNIEVDNDDFSLDGGNLQLNTDEGSIHFQSETPSLGNQFELQLNSTDSVRIFNNGIVTGGAAVNITTGVLEVCDGGIDVFDFNNPGMQVGNVTINADKVLVKHGGIDLGLDPDTGGDINITATDSVIIKDSGISTEGGNVTVQTEGDMVIRDAGIISKGGDIFVTGGSIRVSDNGITSVGEMDGEGGNITLQSTGPISLTNLGLRSDGGSIEVTACRAPITIIGDNSSETISSGGGVVTILAPGGSITATGTTTINTQGGAAMGGMVNIQEENPGDISIEGEMVGADINLSTISTASSFCNQIFPIPTLGQWGIMILCLLLLIIGIVGINVVRFKIS